MRRLALIICAALLFTTSASAADFETIFDGKSLDGWEGKKDFWSVSEGAITGRTTKENPTKGNTFLIWRKGEVADFELHLKFRIVNGNSGIQYRSKELDNFVVGGYQADFEAGTRYIGILYEERGRGILAQRTQKVEIGSDGKKNVVGETCDDKEFLAALKKEKWNDYVIVAKGNRLVQKINGFTTVDVTDNQSSRAAKKGILALQLHAGPPMVVQFKDIKIKRGTGGND
ncbi:MAG: DUF1080 domain-containing protein [Pirellulaceae bacterium]|jgi:hypothetical protein|nr:DUF1080 domain-containing protein [Pirellulaceae bacterium]MDP7015548.1 DUF1080 domain-containing protein [Pirellulaceae bacterium]